MMKIYSNQTNYMLLILFNSKVDIFQVIYDTQNISLKYKILYNIMMQPCR